MRKGILLVASTIAAALFARSEMGRALRRRLQRALRRRGVLGTARQGLVELLYLPQRLRPSRFRERATRQAADAAFDRAHGVDTGGEIHTTAMHDIESENWVYGITYMPTDVDSFGRVIDASDIEPRRYVFVDYGSGKGRVLLLAARYPFRRVVGVEYSSELHRIAERNLSRVGPAEHSSGPVEPICADAASFPIPEEPVLLYFFNPFERPIMEIVRDRVVGSYESNPRSIVVIYLNPRHSDLWDAVGFLERYASSDEFVVYKTPHWD